MKHVYLETLNRLRRSRKETEPQFWQHEERTKGGLDADTATHIHRIYPKWDSRNKALADGNNGPCGEIGGREKELGDIVHLLTDLRKIETVQHEIQLQLQNQHKEEDTRSHQLVAFILPFATGCIFIVEDFPIAQHTTYLSDHLPRVRHSKIQVNNTSNLFHKRKKTSTWHLEEYDGCSNFCTTLSTLIGELNGRRS